MIIEIINQPEIWAKSKSRPLLKILGLIPNSFSKWPGLISILPQPMDAAAGTEVGDIDLEINNMTEEDSRP